MKWTYIDFFFHSFEMPKKSEKWSGEWSFFIDTLAKLHATKKRDCFCSLFTVHLRHFRKLSNIPLKKQIY